MTFVTLAAFLRCAHTPLTWWNPLWGSCTSLPDKDRPPRARLDSRPDSRCWLDTEAIEATYRDGVLRLTIPIAQKAKPRKITISHTGQDRAINV